MRNIYCSRCSLHLGWMNDCGPTGSFYCDDCKEQDDREEEARAEMADFHMNEE